MRFLTVLLLIVVQLALLPEPVGTLEHSFTAYGRDAIIPRPKVIKTLSGSIWVGSETLMLVDKDIDKELNPRVDELRQMIRRMPQTGGQSTITIKRSQDPLFMSMNVNASLAVQGYRMIIAPSGIEIHTRSAQGVTYAVNYLEQLLHSSGKLDCMDISDWPSLSIRGLHIVIGPGGLAEQAVSIETVKKILDLAGRSNYNTLIVQLSNAVSFKNAVTVRTGAWTVQEFIDILRYSRRLGMDIVIDVNLLTHQEKLLGNRYPALMYNKVTYDPRNERIYQIIFPYLQEIVSTIHPKAILVGHDEVAGIGEWSKKNVLNPGEEMLPADLYLQDVMRLHAFLKTLGVEMWMWSDMLIAPHEFPTMDPKHMGGRAPGYGRRLREKIPRDIVICDWHYADRQHDFPTINTFKEMGFIVLGTAWDKIDTTKRFSSYAVKNGADGMIATTWQHVAKRNWAVLNQIVSESGRMFFVSP